MLQNFASALLLGVALPGAVLSDLALGAPLGFPEAQFAPAQFAPAQFAPAQFTPAPFAPAQWVATDDPRSESARGAAARSASRASDAVEAALIRTDDKLDLRGDFYPPRGLDSGRAPAVLLLHDAGQDRTSVAELAAALQRAKLGVLTLDLRGHGESVAPDRNWAEMDEAAHETLWAFATRDVAAAARWLAERDDIHSSSLTLVAVGSAGTLAVRHAIRDENVRGIALLGLPQETFGFDFESDLRDIEGLPLSLNAPKEDREAAESLVEAVHGANWIGLTALRASREELLADKRLRKDLVAWVEQQATPKRGGR
jgi:dienelactone hydrolase